MIKLIYPPDYISASTGYTKGYMVGKQYTLMERQPRLHEVALNSIANARYENLVLMLSEVAYIINKMLEDI